MNYAHWYVKDVGVEWNSCTIIIYNFGHLWDRKMSLMERCPHLSGDVYPCACIHPLNSCPRALVMYNKNIYIVDIRTKLHSQK